MNDSRGWSMPLDQWPRDTQRWARYLAEIDDRILAVRAQEGHEPWRTFGTDMAGFADPTALPVGPITMPTNRVPAWERRLAS